MGQHIHSPSALFPKFAPILSVVLLFGCATTTREVPARLYSLSDGQVIQATFSFSGSTSGTITVPLASGEILRGEYRTLRSGATGWGAIFSQGGATAVGTINTRSAEYRGVAIASGAQGTVIECEYVTSSSSRRPEGYGACRDNHARIYRLVF